MVGLGNVSVTRTFKPMGSREGRGSGEGRHATRKRAHIGTAGTWEQLARSLAHGSLQGAREMDGPNNLIS